VTKCLLSAAAQLVIVNFLTKQNVKPAEILLRLRAQFGDETLSTIQVSDWSKSFKESRTVADNMRRLYLLQGKIRAAFFGLHKVSYSFIF